MEARRADLALQNRKIRFQVEGRIGCGQRKIQIFRKTIEPVKDAERRSAVKRRRFEKTCARKPAESDLLHDLFQRIALLPQGIGAILFQHLADDRLHITFPP